MADVSKPAARVSISLTYNGRGITGQNGKKSLNITPMITSLEYANFARGQVDDIQVSIFDADRSLAAKLAPLAGSELHAEIIRTDETGRKSILPCGNFAIDAPSYRSPGIMTLKAASASVSTSMRRQKKVAIWGSMTLKQLATGIGARYGVNVQFIGPDTPAINTLHQKDVADLKFLFDQSARLGYSVKVQNNEFVVYQQAAMDHQTPLLTLHRDGGTVIDWDFKEDQIDTYTACQVFYHHPDQGLLQTIYKDPNADSENGQTLVVREHVANMAEARAVAQAKLQAANRKRLCTDFTVIGDTRLRAGIVVALSGWTSFDGNYMVDESRHTVGSGYTTSMKLVKVVY